MPKTQSTNSPQTDRRDKKLGSRLTYASLGV
jgi:hypothetical protein